MKLNLVIFLILSVFCFYTHTKNRNNQTKTNSAYINHQRFINQPQRTHPYFSTTAQDIKPNTCQLASSQYELMDGTLSDYWAQELIGSDLLREELKKIPPPEKTNFIAVFDSREGANPKNDLDSHAIIVKNLISDGNNHAVLPQLGKQLTVFNITNPEDYLLLANYLIENNTPSFINNSLHWIINDNTYYNAFRSLTPPSIVITASGNGGIFSTSPSAPIKHTKHIASKDFDMIIVGSFSPRGMVSHFSKFGEEVHILAPADHYISSAKEDGSYRRFGGTSAAAPLVTASLAGFEWLSGYHPTAKEAKFLLEKTALPNLHLHEEPKQNGMGLLNSYQLGMVAKKLKEKCENKNNSCFQKEIKNLDNYVFDINKNQLQNKINQFFPNCKENSSTSNTSLITQNNCQNRKKIFKELRQSILLAPNQRDLWNTLSCIYQEEGFFQNSQMIDRINASLGEEKEIISAIQSILTEDEKGTSLSLLSQYQNIIGLDRVFNWLNEFSKNKSNTIQLNVAQVAGQIGGERGMNLLTELSRNSSDAVQTGVIHIVAEIGTPEGIYLLQELIENGSIYIKIQAIKALGKIDDAKSIHILNNLSENLSTDVRAAVAKAAQSINLLEGIHLLKKLSTDPSPKVRRNVAYTATHLNHPKAIILLQTLSEDIDEKVKRTAERGLQSSIHLTLQY